MYITNKISFDNLDQEQIRKLNSLTKYPSIPTYHKLNEHDGTLSESHIEINETVSVSEKIDGANARIIVSPEGEYFIGSREELLFYYTDKLFQSKQNIVETLQNKFGLSLITDSNFISPVMKAKNYIAIYYFEIYGGKGITPASKNYSSKDISSFKVIDAKFIPIAFWKEVLNKWSLANISGWRESIHNQFLYIDELKELAKYLMPQELAQFRAGLLPAKIEDTYECLKILLPKSKAVLDPHATGKPEGVVLRTATRAIAKLKFSHYERTIRLKKSNK